MEPLHFRGAILPRCPGDPPETTTSPDGETFPLREVNAGRAIVPQRPDRGWINTEGLES